MLKKCLISLLCLCLLMFAGLFVAGWWMVDYAFKTNRHRQSITAEQLDSTKKFYPNIAPWIDSLRNAKALRDTFITMPNGQRGHALYVKSPKAHGHTAILVHGYKDSSIGMLPIASIYNNVMGWNVVLPDLYAHGLSDGDHIRMGWLDRKDVIRWAEAMKPVMQSDGDSTVMVLHGVSMGAATVMYCAGDRTLPKYVRGIVEDCGYSSVWAELRVQLRHQFNLPAFPLLYSASIVNKMRYSWRLGEASAVRSVAQSTVPMLFIHGSSDTFVPTWMVMPCYDAKQKGSKMLWIAPNSEHAMSYKDHTGEYTSHVVTFASSL